EAYCPLCAGNTRFCDMDCFNFAVIGSGPAGVAAARQLAGHGVCVIDAGEEPQTHFPYKTLRDALVASGTTALLGSKWERWGNILEPGKAHAKLRSPAIRYVLGGETFRVFDERGLLLVRGAGSYAAGGMSNAWGGCFDTSIVISLRRVIGRSVHRS